MTRRQLLAYSGAAGVMASLPAGLAAPAAGEGPSRPARRRRGTLFFNFSHEDHARSTYFVAIEGKRYRLLPVVEHLAILRRARRTNAFLRGIPNEALTHVLNDASLPADAVQLCYVVSNPDPTTGTWSMSAASMFFSLPTSAVLGAFRRAVARAGSGPLPYSAKRRKYGLPPAQSARDLLEEQSLKDVTDQATVMVVIHPELLSADPTSAADIQLNIVQPNGATMELGEQLAALGPATPQQTPGQPNPAGWATLTPIPDPENGNQPFRNQTGAHQGLIQYHPDWSVQIAGFGAAASALSQGLGQVKDDPTYGADVTSLDPSTTPPSLAGALWKRHDGFTTIDESPGGGAVQDSLAYTLTTQNIEGGFSCTGSATLQANGSVQATLTFTNWYVRWLGVFILFLDSDDKPLDASGTAIQVPSDYSTDAGSRAALQVESALFALLLGPEFTLMGIPVQNATATVTFTVPAAAHTVRVFAAGPSMQILGGIDPNDPTTWGDPTAGMMCTVLLNYGLVTLLMAAGRSDSLSAIQKAALPLAASIVVDLVNLIGDQFRNQDFGKANAWQQMGAATMKAFLASVTGQAVKLLALITLDLTLGIAEDNIPLVGQIMLVISLVAGVATLLETTLEIAASPISYVYDLVLTHDLSVTILPQAGNPFPAVASYCKVTALFDNEGTPMVQTLDVPRPAPGSLPVTFTNVPRGGQVNISAAFYSRSADPTQNDWLAAKGSTGLVSNDVDQAPDLTIEEFPVPIKSTTVYQHRQKTALELENAAVVHVWQALPAPTTKATDVPCAGAGTLCDFRSITVRQGTSSAQPAYVGYAWEAWNRGGECVAGQGDQLANLGVADAQAGYVNGPCGLPAGVRLTYSLLTQGMSNFYLDTTARIVRQIQLDPAPPRFASPSGNQAWGVLNLDSDRLLLHPSGRLVSINAANNRIETLSLPAAAATDADAQRNLLARIHCGKGTRPGLLETPAAAAISSDGVILILEAQNNRLQAFDLGANPVQLFSKQSPPYFLALDATDDPDTVYLDLAVEYTGYLYVLSYNQSQSSPSYNVYRLDVYHPDQSGTAPISTTLNVNAAKLTVDFWRSVYALNYELLQLPGGTLPPITEPSVSQWTPST